MKIEGLLYNKWDEFDGKFRYYPDEEDIFTHCFVFHNNTLYRVIEEGGYKHPIAENIDLNGAKTLVAYRIELLKTDKETQKLINKHIIEKLKDSNRNLIKKNKYLKMYLEKILERKSK